MKNKSMKRFVALALLLCLLPALLVGCRNNQADPTETPSASTDGTTGSSAPTQQSNAPSTAPSTAPTEPGTQPTEPSTAPTEPSTQPTEPSTAPTEPSTQPTEPSTAPTEPSFPGVTWETVNETVYATSSVNVRTGPGTSYEKIGQLKQSEAVKRVAIGSNGWSRVEYKGEYAYISSNYLTTKQPQPAATQPANPQPDNNQQNKVIYLTFDDGPSSYTPELLAVLAKYNVKATFFVIGDSELQYLDDIVQGGHAIGIHSNTHKYDLIYSSTDAFWNDFYTMDNIIYQYTGVHTNLFRFPGGSSNTVSKNYCVGIMTQLAKELQDKGYYYFDWNVDSDDAGSARTAAEVYSNVIAGVKGKAYSVVLMHDVKSYTVDAIEDILIWGLQNGYTFEALDENSPVVHHTLRN